MYVSNEWCLRSLETFLPFREEEDQSLKLALGLPWV